MTHGIADIYAILDVDGAVQYVGRTRGGVAERLRNHSYEMTPIADWIRKNMDTLQVRILESIHWSEESATEQKWIDHYVDEGCQLLNRRKKLKFGNALKQLKVCKFPKAGEDA